MYIFFKSVFIKYKGLKAIVAKHYLQFTIGTFNTPYFVDIYVS